MSRGALHFKKGATAKLARPAELARIVITRDASRRHIVWGEPHAESGKTQSQGDFCGIAPRADNISIANRNFSYFLVFVLDRTEAQQLNWDNTVTWCSPKSKGFG
jgi:hypothetical protein